MKPRPATPSSIPTKLTVNFVLPYAAELLAKEIKCLLSFLEDLIQHSGTSCIVHWWASWGFNPFAVLPQVIPATTFILVLIALSACLKLGDIHSHG
ncbi:unnamed protein product [Malus baccata var. baccata]